MRAARAPFTKAGDVLVRRVDGTFDLQPAYTGAEFQNVLTRGPGPKSATQRITLSSEGTCCVCGTAIERGARARWWPKIQQVSCLKHRTHQGDRLGQQLQARGRR